MHVESATTDGPATPIPPLPEGTTRAPRMLTLFTRPHEIQLGIIRADAGICSRCDKPLAEGKFAWDHRITTGPTDPIGPFVIGEKWFACLRHVDGTPCGDNPNLNYDCYPKPVCGACGAIDSYQHQQQGYGVLRTCKVCGDSKWTDRGD